LLQLPPTVLTGGAVILSRGEGRQCRRVAAWSPSGASTQDLLHSPSDGDDASSGIASSGNSGAVCKMIGRNYGMGVVVWFYELFVVEERWWRQHGGCKRNHFQDFYKAKFARRWLLLKSVPAALLYSFVTAFCRSDPARFSGKGHASLKCMRSLIVFTLACFRSTSRRRVVKRGSTPDSSSTTH